MTLERHPGQQRPSLLTTPYPNKHELNRITQVTTAAAHRAVVNIARTLGAEAAPGAGQPGSVSGNVIEPLAGVRAAMEMERVSKSLATEYIRAAREAGHSWHDIGPALSMMNGAMTGNMREPIEDTAYIYANEDAPATARIYDRPFTWNCATCENVVSDYGVLYGPALDEVGHAEDCARYVEAIAEWDAEAGLAEWQAKPEAERECREADWEAGQ